MKKLLIPIIILMLSCNKKQDPQPATSTTPTQSCKCMQTERYNLANTGEPPRYYYHDVIVGTNSCEELFKTSPKTTDPNFTYKTICK